MRFFLVNTAYDAFLKSLYAEQPGLADASYSEQMRVLDESFFGTADFLRSNLEVLGHTATETVANNVPMQLAWARERMPRPLRPAVGMALRRRLPLSRILSAQIRAARPDVVLNLDMRSIPAELLRRAAPVALLVGQHGATTFPRIEPFRAYDLVLSQVRPTVTFFRQHGVPAEELRLAFEPRILDSLAGHAPPSDIVFVGSLFPGVHDGRIRLLESVCAQFPQTRIWSASVDHLPAGSAIRRCYQGQAWGRRMYEVFRSARLVLNNHGGGYHGSGFRLAENSRLYEATGTGGFVLTEAHPNLSELFEPDLEVGTYRDDGDCLTAIKRYLADDLLRRTIAAAGQARTLKEHTYRQRMAELIEIVQQRLPHREMPGRE
jgi:spore maturation protein CgeB